MTEDVRALGLQLTALCHRVGQLENALTRLKGRQAARDTRNSKFKQAMQLAAELGIDETFCVATRNADNRRRLAVGLRERKWTYQEIANVLGCSERTVERYFSARGPDDCPDNAQATA